MHNLKLYIFLAIFFLLATHGFGSVEFQENEVKDLIVVFDTSGLAFSSNSKDYSSKKVFSVQNTNSATSKEEFLSVHQSNKERMNTFVEKAKKDYPQEEYVKTVKPNITTSSIDLNITSSSKNNTSIIRVSNLKDIDTRRNFEYKNLFSGITLQNVNEETYSELVKNFPQFNFYEDNPVQILVSNETRNLLNISQSRILANGATNLTGKGIRVAVLDTGIDPTHPDFGSCKGFTGEKIVSNYDTIPYTLESPHPYPNRFNETYQITLSNNVSSFQIFFKNYSIEEGFDVLNIYNSTNDLVQKITGEGENVSSIIINGNNATLNLFSDSVITDYGFFINETRVNLTTSTAQCSRIVEQENMFEETYAYDKQGHGTHVASIIASNNSNADLRGVAPEVDLMIYKVLSESGGSISSVVAGIDRSLDPNNDSNFSDRADIVSLSLGGNGNANDLLSMAIDNVSKLGVIPIIAAGNSYNYNTIASPGVSREAITVGATYKENENYSSFSGNIDDIAQFSSRGPTSIGTIKPDIVAPGVNICAALTSYTTDDYSSNFCQNSNQHFKISGTSMATPIVSGVVALMKQKNSSLTTQQIKSMLRATSKQIDEDVFTQGWGRVQPYEFLSLNNVACQVYFNTSHLSSIDSYVDNYSINASINCPNFQNYTLKYSNLYSNLSTINTSIIETRTTQGRINLRFNITEDTSDSILLTLEAQDINTSYSNYDSLFLNTEGSEISENNEISSCVDIEEPGTYNLTSSISYGVFDTNYECIDINSNNVELDCRGFSISGEGSRDGIDTTFYDNISINNCHVSEFSNGVDIYSSKSITIANSTFSNLNRGVDISLSSSNINIVNSTFKHVDTGVYSFSSSSKDITVKDSLFENNSYYSINVRSPGGIVINNSFMENNSNIRINDIRENSSNIIENSFFNSITLAFYNSSSCNSLQIINSSNLQGKQHIYSSDSITLNNRDLASLTLCGSFNSDIENISINNSILHLLYTDSLQLRDVSIESNSSRSLREPLMRIYKSSNNYFENISIISSNTGFDIGLGLDESSNTTFKDLYIENFFYGFYIDSENFNNTFDTIVMNNNTAGLYFNVGNYLNTVVNSTINQSLASIYLDERNTNNEYRNNLIINSNYSFYFDTRNDNNLIQNNSFKHTQFQIFQDPLNYANSNNTFIMNTFNRSKINVTNAFLNNSRFNYPNDGEQVGNYWEGFKCSEFERSGSVFRCVNPSNYTINSTLGVIDNAPLTISWFNFTNIIDDLNIISNNRGALMSFIFNRNISYISLNATQDNETYTLYESSINSINFTQKVPLRYGDNNITMFAQDEYGFNAMYHIKNLTLSLNMSNVEKNVKVDGNVSNIFTNIDNLSIKINKSQNLSNNFTNIKTIELANQNKTFVKFNSNFSKKKLNLTSIQIRERNYNNKTQLLSSGIELSDNNTKTLYIQLQGDVARDRSLCIQDRELEDFSKLSQNCSKPGELYFNNISSFNNSKYSVSVYNESLNIIEIMGLENSGVSQVCSENWQYSDWSSCSSGTQTRTASDVNNCGTTHTRKNLTQTCTFSQTNDDDEDNNQDSGSSGGGGGGRTTGRGFAPTSTSDENSAVSDSTIDNSSKTDAKLNNSNINTSDKNSIVNKDSLNSQYSIEIDKKSVASNSTFTGVKTIEIKEDTNPIMSFKHDFSQSDLDLGTMEIISPKEDESDNYIIVSSLDLNTDTKTIRLEQKFNYSHVCIRDEEISSISQISDECEDEKEFIINCRNENNLNNQDNDQISCNIENNYFVVSGLSHSGVVEFENQLFEKNETSAAITQAIDSQNSNTSSNIIWGIILFVIIIVVGVTTFAVVMTLKRDNQQRKGNFHDSFQDLKEYKKKSKNLSEHEEKQLEIAKQYIQDNSTHYDRESLIKMLKNSEFSENVLEMLKK